MNLKYQLLLYFDKNNILLEMKNACQQYLKQFSLKTEMKFPPCRFLLDIDVMNLLDFSADVGEHLLREPWKWQIICNEILLACLQSVNEDEDRSVDPAQVSVILRPKCIPLLLVPRNQSKHNGISRYYGVLLAISKPTSYAYHTVWSCPEECEGNEVILHFIPKVSPKCYICKSVLFENSGLRRCGDQVTATFKLTNKLSKTFKINDDMITDLKVGSKYDIFAVTVKKTSLVWSLEEVVPQCAPPTAPIPSDIGGLMKACKGVPWQFVYCLASSIGVNVCPLHCFMHIKINLLLSLASAKANAVTGTTLIHVLVAGNDTGYVGRLMEEAAKLADNSVFLGTSNTSASTALVASSGGVCAMPLPLHAYNKKEAALVLSSIETGEVSTETDRAKLLCAVWAQGMDFKKLNLLNVASIFGTVSRGDYGEYSDEIVDFVLQNAVEPPETSKEEIEALKDIKNYLDLVSGIDVSMDVKAEALLRNYFLAARRERPRGVTVGSMASLVAICLTSARLCRRRSTNVDDAVLAVWLHVCGSPEPRAAPDEYLRTPPDVKSLQNIMADFKGWLEQFTGNLISIS